MSSPALPLRTALVARLKASPALSGVLAGPGVFGGVAPQNAALPYVVLGEPGEDKHRAFSGRVASRTNAETLHIWGRSASEVLAIYREIDALLDGQGFDLEGHRVASGRTRLVTVLLDPDGKTFHGVVEYIARIAPRRP